MSYVIRQLEHGNLNPCATLFMLLHDSNNNDADYNLIVGIEIEGEQEITEKGMKAKNNKLIIKNETLNSFEILEEIHKIEEKELVN